MKVTTNYNRNQYKHDIWYYTIRDAHDKRWSRAEFQAAKVSRRRICRENGANGWRQNSGFPWCRTLLQSFHRPLEYLHYVLDACVFWILILWTHFFFVVHSNFQICFCKNKSIICTEWLCMHDAALMKKLTTAVYFLSDEIQHGSGQPTIYRQTSPNDTSRHLQFSHTKSICVETLTFTTAYRQRKNYVLIN